MQAQRLGESLLGFVEERLDGWGADERVGGLERTQMVGSRGREDREDERVERALVVGGGRRREENAREHPEESAVQEAEVGK